MECAYLFHFQSWNDSFSIQVDYHTQIGYIVIKCTKSLENVFAASKNA